MVCNAFLWKAAVDSAVPADARNKRKHAQTSLLKSYLHALIDKLIT